MNILDYLIQLVAGNASLQFYQALAPILMLLLIYLAYLLNSVLVKLENKMDKFIKDFDEKYKAQCDENEDEHDQLKTRIITLETKESIATQQYFENSDSSFGLINQLITDSKTVDDQIILTPEGFEKLKQLVKQQETRGVKVLNRSSRLRSL